MPIPSSQQFSFLNEFYIVGNTKGDEDDDEEEEKRRKKNNSNDEMGI